LLLLSDSALPIGSFAFSSGLESFVHHLPTSAASSQDTLFHFLRESLRSLGYTTLPFVKAAHSKPHDAVSLDDHFDATVTCPVARRASLAQGKALVTVWEKAFLEDKKIGDSYRADVKSGLGGHFGVAWGVVCGHSGISKGIFLEYEIKIRALHVCLPTESCQSGGIGCSPARDGRTISSTRTSCNFPNPPTPTRHPRRNKQSRH
jgi:urease accessory protein UreF